jgi:hypothetical protein
MKFTTLLATASAVAIMLPVAAFAATYQYVGTNGALETITADTADQALVNAPDIAPHSGVILVTPTVMVVGTPAVVTTAATSTSSVSGVMSTTTVMSQTMPVTGMSSTTVTTTASSTATSTQS